MARKSTSGTFIQQIKRQLLSLLDSRTGYESLHVYVAGISEPWPFASQAEFEFHEDTNVLIVRTGASDENGHDGEVPEYVFRLDSIVATQLM
jgi:hypothetical protein